LAWPSEYRVGVGVTPRLRLGRLDHVHIRVPDRAEAAAWYAAHLGFEPVEEYRFWVDGVEDGPLQMSADGGATSIALFQASDAHPIVPQSVAFRVDAESFVAFGRSLPGQICGPGGAALQLGDVRDFDLCWAFDIVDPWGHHYELNCFDYERVRAELIEVEGVVPVRYWPADLHRRFLGHA
jgi:catechol 2,3-dioxygenase-like lactoylglutathione lyase family enzyme